MDYDLVWQTGNNMWCVINLLIRSIVIILVNIPVIIVMNWCTCFIQCRDGETDVVSSLRGALTSLQGDNASLQQQLDDRTRQLEDLTFRLEEETCNAADLEVRGGGAATLLKWKSAV